MTRVTPGTAVAAAISAASAGAVAGVVFIFQLPAMITGRIDPIIGGRRRARAPWRARAPLPDPPRARCCMPPRAAASIRANARWTRARLMSRRSAKLAERRLRSGTALECDALLERRQVGEAHRSPRARSIVASWRTLEAHRAAQVGGLRVEDPVQVAVELARDEARLELEDARRRAAPAQEREHSLVALHGHHAAAAAHRAREPGTPASARRAASIGASRGATTSSRCEPAGPRLSEPAARKRPRSHAERQCGRAAGPVDVGRVTDAPTPPLVREPDREARDDRRAGAAGRRGTQAEPLGDPAAGARRVDGCELGAHRLDERRGPVGVAAPGDGRPQALSAWRHGAWPDRGPLLEERMSASVSSDRVVPVRVRPVHDSGEDDARLGRHPQAGRCGPAGRA